MPVVSKHNVQRAARGGFTLMELLLVVSMLSVVALLFISYTGDVGNVSVDSASWKIQSDIRHAQQLATSSGTKHGVKFVQNGNYVVYSNNETTPILDPLDRQPMNENVAQFGNVVIGNNFRVEFDKIGNPTMGGGGNVEIIADSGASRRIYVIDNTGAVIVDVLNYGSGCNCDLCEVKK